MIYYVRLSKTIHRQIRNLPGHIRSVANQKILSLAKILIRQMRKNSTDTQATFAFGLMVIFALFGKSLKMNK